MNDRPPSPASAPEGAEGRPLISVKRRERRRFLFFSSVLLITGLATSVLADLLWHDGFRPDEVVLLALFAPLCAMVAHGFTQAVAGWVVLARRRDRTRLSHTLRGPVRPDDLPVTAIVLPIYNENVREVYEGLRVIYRSLERAGTLSRFDFFILSDSGDPDKWIEEETAWVELCKQVRGFSRIFYRRRRLPINRKSGNIADFCRRWGSRYRYMVVLDADSLMSGRSLVSLVALMEANPRVGIVQTAPVLYGATTPFGRLMQFASAAYGPVFSAGQHYWQLDEGNYWGHNAIIRLKPFIDHCGLPGVPGGRAGGRYMSHDYVEAALMTKFGYEVWLAYDLPGSLEGGPPTLIDHAKRDLRWCRGNLQHAWLLFAKGFRAVSRVHLGLGVLSYASSLLWLLFLAAGTWYTYRCTRFGAAAAGDQGTGLLSRLGVNAHVPLFLFATFVTMLLLPKILGAWLVLRSRARRRRFGGGGRFLLGVVFEQAGATLLAPVQMLFNAVFVVSVLCGRAVHWTTQNRDAAGVDWREAMLTHVGHTVVGVVWGMLAWAVNPFFFLWMTPVLAGLVLSVPLSILLSHRGLGELMGRSRWLLTPMQSTPPPEVVEISRRLEAYGEEIALSDALWRHRGFMAVALDPLVNAVHVALLRQRGKADREVALYYRRLLERVLREGPEGLSRREQMALLLHPRVVADLHARVWLSPDRDLAAWWRVAMTQYNLLAGRSVHLLQP
jgi:membrane glycosyltransferase